MKSKYRGSAWRGSEVAIIQENRILEQVGEAQILVQGALIASLTNRGKVIFLQAKTAVGVGSTGLVDTGMPSR